MHEPCARRRVLLLALGALALGPALGAEGPPPALMLAKVWRAGMPLADYWVSEKYDGVRGSWDGTQLLTRGGRCVAAPDWFTADWPAQALDGELWAGRGRFDAAPSAVPQHKDADAAGLNASGVPRFASFLRVRTVE